MISKSTIKLIKSLAIKKFRSKEKLFLVEGDKNITEVLKSDFEIEKLYATKDFFNDCNISNSSSFQEVSKEEIRKASLLKNPQNALAICKIPEKLLLPEKINESLSLYLDCIQDPGNLGTIIRICDWFGIQKLFCSSDTADVYNPKTIQATMGSFCRVNTFYISEAEIQKIAKQSEATIYGAFLEGENLYQSALHKKSILVIGNEGNGIRNRVENLVKRKISIPSFSVNKENAESLNAAVATGIICAEFKRQLM